MNRASEEFENKCLCFFFFSFFFLKKKLGKMVVEMNEIKEPESPMWTLISIQ